MQLALVGGHDLAPDGQPQPRMRAAGRAVVGLLLLRAVGVEALEHRFQHVFGDARPFVLDRDAHAVRLRLDLEAHRRRAAGRKGDGVVDEVAQHLCEGRAEGLDEGLALGRPEIAHARCVRGRGGVVEVHQAAAELAHIHDLGALAGEVGVHARGRADVADEAVHPAHIRLDDAEQLAALRIRFGSAQ